MSAAPGWTAALEQRAYHVHCALVAAENTERLATARARQIFDDWIDGRAGVFGLSAVAAVAREWRGSAKACRREERRLAKLKHGGAQ
ncbi:MAG: hypothetical protein GX856_07060 [Gammaproteobacteria bacterium]|nr:hypothetical protein [Gammaproteobacteria bacterium]